jgi:hypothetical protein
VHKLPGIAFVGSCVCVGTGPRRSCRKATIRASISWSTIVGPNGRAYREADVETADLETVIVDLLGGEYNNTIRVVAFNTAEGWSQDVSEDIAQELRRRCDLQMSDLPSSIQDFIERHEGRDRQLTLRLVSS